MSDQPHYPHTSADGAARPNDATDTAADTTTSRSRTVLLSVLAVFALAAVLVTLHLTGVVGG
ncbi:MAG: hypothetical protein ACRCYQ_10090 [Nocardioides sp.]